MLVSTSLRECLYLPEGKTSFKNLSSLPGVDCAKLSSSRTVSGTEVELIEVLGLTEERKSEVDS